LTGQLKAIRDKTESFFVLELDRMGQKPFGVAKQEASRWWDEVAQRVIESAQGPGHENPDDDEGVSGVRIEPGSEPPAPRASGRPAVAFLDPCTLGTTGMIAQPLRCLYP
jgi:hypothetical protein